MDIESSESAGWYTKSERVAEAALESLTDNADKVLAVLEAAEEFDQAYGRGNGKRQSAAKSALFEAVRALREKG